MDLLSYRQLVADCRGRAIAGRYVIRAGLGFGESGAVFLGQDRWNKRFVAVRRYAVDADDRYRVVSLVDRLLALEDSRNIVRCLGYDTEEPTPEEVAAQPDSAKQSLWFYVVSEFGGVSLERYLRRLGAEACGDYLDLSFRRRNEMLSIHVATEALTGLREAQKHGIVHRTFGPARIFLGFDGSVCVGGFDLADADVSREPFLKATIVADPCLAPEHVAGERCDHLSDIFCVGAVLYRMLTGRSPFANAFEICQRDPDLGLPGIFPGMDAILGRALAREPAGRYPDAQAMIRDLEIYERQRNPVDLGELLDACRRGVPLLLSDEVRAHLGVSSAPREAETGRRSGRARTGCPELRRSGRGHEPHGSPGRRRRGARRPGGHRGRVPLPRLRARSRRGYGQRPACHEPRDHVAAP